MPDWTESLAREIFEDRVDRGVSREGAEQRARRYRAWLAHLSDSHDRATCPEEALIRRWPADLCFHTGQATVFVARQGAGKTNTLAYLIQKAIEHRPEWDLFTNIPFPWEGRLAGTVPAPPRLYPIASLSQLLRGIANTILGGRIPAVVVDEMDQASTSHEWASDRSESWTKFLYVERHFRVRGPLLAYHVYEHVPLPLRRVGDLRGSYFRVVVLGGEHLLARVEETSAWWGVRESVLPYLTLGLRGFDLDVDMAYLERHLNGDREEVGGQTLAYLDELVQRRQREASDQFATARAAHLGAISERRVAITEREHALEARNERIVQLLMVRPEATNTELTAEFHVSREMLARLRNVAHERTRPVADRTVRGSEAAP